MSTEAMAWAMSQTGLKPSEKLVLIAIADIANEQHGYEYWGGSEYLCEFTGLARVEKQLQALRDAGLMVLVKAAANGSRAVYRLEVQKNQPRRQEGVSPAVRRGSAPPSGGAYINTTDNSRETQTTPPSAIAHARTQTDQMLPMDELVAIFGEPSASSGGAWALYQQIVGLAKGHPPGEITRRAQRHIAGYDFALTPGSFKKRWDELGGQAAELNTLTLKERKQRLAKTRSDEWMAAKVAEEEREKRDRMERSQRGQRMDAAPVAEPGQQVDRRSGGGGESGPAGPGAARGYVELPASLSREESGLPAGASARDQRNDQGNPTAAKAVPPDHGTEWHAVEESDRTAVRSRRIEAVSGDVGLRLLGGGRRALRRGSEGGPAGRT